VSLEPETKRRETRTRKIDRNTKDRKKGQLEECWEGGGEKVEMKRRRESRDL
jgi:hypothetical protein